MQKVAILYHPKIPRAEELAGELANLIRSSDVSVWTCSAWEVEEVRGSIEGTDLILSIGGDGTMLRVARAVVPWPIPILGINLGKFGFMTELSPDEALDRVPAFLSGEGWVEERTMLQVDPPTEGGSFHALNDVVVGRGAIPRVVHVEVSVDGEPLTTYKADGVIVATATGSTGYSLAAGGPILYPQSSEILLNPISPHLTLNHTIVLPPTVEVTLKVSTDHQAVLSIDGQVNLPLQSGDVVRIKRSPHATRFLRAQPPTYFYATLAQRLSGTKAGELDRIDIGRRI